MLCLIAIFISVFIFSGCKTDPDTDTPVIDISLLQGEWLSLDNTQNLITDVSFSQYRFSGSVYKNSEIDYTIEGRWAYVASSGRLTMDIDYSTSSSIVSKTYSISNLNKNMLQLNDIELSSQKTFYRVVEKYDICIGDQLYIRYGTEGMSYSTYTSSDTKIAIVDEFGNVTAKNIGTCFVSIKDATTTCYVKIVVSPRVPKYSEEILFNIDKILQVYGTPTKTSEYNGLKIADYDFPSFDTGLIGVEYWYDETTRHVREIFTFYKNKDAYNAEVDYLSKNFYELDGTYCLYKEVSRNNFYIYPYTLDGLLIIGYERLYW